MGQNGAKTVNGVVITIKNGTTFTNKHAVCHCPVYNFQKMAIFHMILRYDFDLFSLDHSMSYSYPRVINSTLLSPKV